MDPFYLGMTGLIVGSLYLTYTQNNPVFLVGVVLAFALLALKRQR